MLSLMAFLQNWFSDCERTDEDRGATMVDTALIVTLIALAAITGITAFGGHLGTFFQRPRLEVLTTRGRVVLPGSR